MNGVHCQVSTVMIVSLAWSLIQSVWRRPNGLRTQLIRPNSVSSRVNFHTRAAAAGMTRNWLMISVRSRPRPKTLRSSGIAIPRPSSSDSRTGTRVRVTVLTMATRQIGSEKMTV